MNRSANGFKVNTDMLSATGVKYSVISAGLSASCRQLQQLQLVLNEQTLPAAIAQSFGQAVAAVRSAVQETSRYGQQCKEIAQVYDRTEKDVQTLVDTLLTRSIFDTVSPPAALAAMQGLDKIFSPPAPTHTIRVDSPLTPIAPVMLAGNRLPCESWLLNRAVKAVGS